MLLRQPDVLKWSSVSGGVERELVYVYICEYRFYI